MIVNNSPVSVLEAAQYSPLTLAYLGDCVYEMYVRERLLLRANTSNGKLHDMAKHYVSASGQSRAVDLLHPLFTKEEESVFRRGRNSCAVPNKNNDIGQYHAATGLEALFGYLYLTGQNQRLEEFIGRIFEDFGV